MGLERNLIAGMTASIALLIALAVIGLRTPQYLRGRHLEGELLLAKLVQRDLQPKPHSISGDLTFAASAVAADHVGGDFYDIFEVSTGEDSHRIGRRLGQGFAGGAVGKRTSGRHTLVYVTAARIGVRPDQPYVM